MSRTFNELFIDCTKHGTKIQKEQYHENGRFPIIDQGQSYIAGYVDTEEGIYNEVPAIIFGDHTRVIKYVDFPFFLGADGVKVLRNVCSDSQVKYLYYALRAAEVPDTGYNRHFKWLRELSFKHPTYNEQQKIADILDKTSELIAGRKKQLEKLDLLVKSRFVEMFGDPVTNPMGWEVCKLGDVAEAIDPHPSHRTPPVSEEGIPYIGIAECNYQTLKIDFERARRVGLDVLNEHLDRYSVDEGDFIIGKIGTIGRPFFIPPEQTYTLSANTVLIKPKNSRISPSYLLKLFQSDYIENQITSERKETSQPALGIQKVRNILILLPPLSLQTRFADFVRQADKSKFTAQKQAEHASLLYNGLKGD